MTFKPVFKPRNLQNLFAVLVQRRQFQLSEQILAAPLKPKQRFQTFTVKESPLLKIHHKIHDLPMVDPLLSRFADRLIGAASQISIDGDDANVVVIF